MHDLAWFCVPPDRRSDPAFVKGREAKEAWIAEKLRTSTPFAKIAYIGSEPVGIIQYEPVPAEPVVHIHCIFVPHDHHWRKGVGTDLLRAVVEEMQRPQPWNGGRPALGIATRTFPGHDPGQLPAQEFFRRRGFEPVGDDPDFLFLPLQPGTRCPPRRAPPTYLPQEEDAGRIVIIHGPSFCLWTYPFRVWAAQAIEKIAPGISIRWIDRSAERPEAEKRGGYEGIVVNLHPIRSSIFDRDDFEREVRETLGG